MQENVAINGIRKETTKGNLEVSRVYKADYQKEGTITAEIKQTVITKSYYPSKSVTNSHQDNVFGMADFKFEEQEYTNKETRVVWLDVPENSSIEIVAERLSQFPDACLYRILGNKPIITDNQRYAIENGLTSMGVIAESQIVRFPKGHSKEGEIALDSNNKPQYRSVFFKSTACEDQDYRNAEPNDFYITDALASEIEVIESIDGNIVVQDTI